jgi:TolB-like protein/DNA-binding winged helix-turn-helix (wHTH) protein/Tfp pilus assembly protein PilF
MTTQPMYEFGPFRLDSKSCVLMRAGAVVPLNPKAFDTLRVLVENHGSPVGKNELMKLVWPDTFVEETNLTQQISILRKALGDTPDGCSYIETIPKRGYRFVAALNVQAPARKKRPNWLVLTATVLVVGGASVLVFAWLSKAGRETNLTTIAVLPFVDMSAAKDQEYFSDGLTEELIDALARVPGLHVAARTSSSAFKGKQQDIRDIGAKLKVGMVLEGSVRQTGQRLRITAQLNSVKSGLHLWSETYDRDGEDIFAVQEEIARAIATALKIRLPTDPNVRLSQQHTVNPDAYNKYLKGRYFWNLRTMESFAKSRQYFEEAIRTDPNYALAYSGLADTYVPGPVGLPTEEALPKARAAARRAIAIEDRLAEPHVVIAEIRFTYDWDWPGAEQDFQRAIQLDPNYATAHHSYSHYLTAMGRHAESLREAQRTLDLDPLEMIISTHMAWCLFYARQYERALAKSHENMDKDPNFLMSKLILGLIYEEKGMYTEAIAVFQDSVRFSKDDVALGYLGNVLGVAGRKEDALRVLGDLQRISKERHVSPYSIALVYVGLGDKDRAFEWLERTYAERSPKLVYLKVEPQLDSIRTDPRFGVLMAKMGLSN